MRSKGGTAPGPDEHQARATARAARKAESKARAAAWREEQLAAFYARRCQCGAQATVFVISKVEKRAVTREYCAEHAPRL